MQFSTIATLCGFIVSTIAGPPNNFDAPPHSQPDTESWPGHSPGPASNELSFYMCCQGSPDSTGIDNYSPPYACIFGPAKGVCPQGVSSSFPYSWLCTYQYGEIGNIDCTYESGPSSTSIVAGAFRPVLNAVGNVAGSIGL